MLAWQDPDSLRVMREVRNMAILSNHANIVRYYGTWLEEAPEAPRPPRRASAEGEDDEEDDEEEGDEGEGEGTWGESYGEEEGGAEAGPVRVTWLYIQVSTDVCLCVRVCACAVTWPCMQMELCGTSLRQWMDRRAAVDLEAVRLRVRDIRSSLYICFI
jgi:hypothetical protein